jgi:protein AATF/BFR2
LAELRFHPWRDETLTKWSDKVKAASGLPVNTKFKVLNQTITQQLRENLTDRERLIERTRIKRGTFNVLGKNVLVDEMREIIDADIFDDLDFYHPLLKDLVERKSLDIPIDSWNRQVKTKVNVKDTRASKGRKLRYHEHEKILNFMAPTAAGAWHEDQIEYDSPVPLVLILFSELFASLLGRRIQVNEGQVPTAPDVVDLNDGLRIFG